MTPKFRGFAAAAVLFGIAAMVLSLKLMGGPTPHASSISTAPSSPVASGERAAQEPPPPAGRPELIVSPDRYGATCGNGVALPARHGAPTRAGRGSPQTSCAFAFNVLTAYRDTQQLPGDPARTLTVESVVPCPGTGAQCRGEGVAVSCEVLAGESWITCADGALSRVYLF